VEAEMDGVDEVDGVDRVDGVDGVDRVDEVKLLPLPRSNSYWCSFVSISGSLFLTAVHWVVGEAHAMFISGSISFFALPFIMYTWLSRDRRPATTSSTPITLFLQAV
jgi:hypothetical protein